MRCPQLTIVGITAGIAAAGCAGPHKAVAPQQTHAPLSRLIQQTGHGLDARFTRCESTACPDRTVKTLREIERAPAVPNVPRMPATHEAQEIQKRIVVRFASGSARLTDNQIKVIDLQFADAMRSRRIAISGRTDDTGSPRGNDLLARKRAEVVRDYLLKRRLNDTVDHVLESKGNCCYSTDNRSAAGRAANRRVEIEMFIVAP